MILLKRDKVKRIVRDIKEMDIGLYNPEIICEVFGCSTELNKHERLIGNRCSKHTKNYSAVKKLNNMIDLKSFAVLVRDTRVAHKAWEKKARKAGKNIMVLYSRYNELAKETDRVVNEILKSDTDTQQDLFVEKIIL